MSLHVTVEPSDGVRREFDFDKPFKIGRFRGCDLCIDDEYVSRAHAEVSLENGQWRVKDLGSSNGLYLEGARVESVPIGRGVNFRLGAYGPKVSIKVEEVKPPEPVPAAPSQPMGEKTMVVRYAERYFSKTNPDRPMGEQTMLIRRAFEQVQHKQKRKYGLIVGLVAAALLGASGYALYLHQQVKKQTELAENLFYSMKSLDVNIAGIQRMVSDSGNQEAGSQMQHLKAQRKDMEKTYDQFLSTLHVRDSGKMTQEEKLILRVARIFGECELSMPPGFVAEVEKYIKLWQSSGRLARDINVAQTNGYVSRIAQEMLAQGLPPEFFYLALQESNFDQYSSGPMTRKGIAKGMWQFIPETAEKYGLKIGPLAELRRPDPADDRHHWDRETRAAARYIRDLYSMDAQASGLLVMACYNWGEMHVMPLVQSIPMPANPRDRNFWVLLSKYKDKVPDETYNYVFSIVAAAVIGENPEFFGFDFANPLGHLEAK